MDPFHQHFSLRNRDLQYPFATHQRIPFAAAIVIAVLVPIVIIAFTTLGIGGISRLHRSRSSSVAFHDRLYEFNTAVRGILSSEALVFLVTVVFKKACGKPRPDLIDRCQPQDMSDDPPIYGLASIAVCTQQDQGILQDGFQSFPSGHSSGMYECMTANTILTLLVAAFAGLFFLTLYLSFKVQPLSPLHGTSFWRALVVLTPTLAASLIALSRIMDARHHPFDVLFGSFLGILSSVVAWKMYFPRGSLRGDGYGELKGSGNGDEELRDMGRVERGRQDSPGARAGFSGRSRSE